MNTWFLIAIQKLFTLLFIGEKIVNTALTSY